MVRLPCTEMCRIATDTKSGLHLSPAGYEILFQELMKVVGERWPDQSPEKLPMVLPPWNDAEAWKVWEKQYAGAQ